MLVWALAAVRALVAAETAAKICQCMPGDTCLPPGVAPILAHSDGDLRAHGLGHALFRSITAPAQVHEHSDPALHAHVRPLLRPLMVDFYIFQSVAKHKGFWS